MKSWTSNDKCPICGRPFKSEYCPHSYVEAQQRLKDNHIREVVRDEIRRNKSSR